MHRNAMGFIGHILHHYEECFFGLIAVGGFSIFLYRGGNVKQRWEGHLSRLRSVNVVAVIMFILSVAKITAEYKSAMDKIKLLELSTPFLGLIMSFTYFVGFLGVTFVSPLLDENTSSSIPPETIDNTALDSNSTPDIAVVGGGCTGCSVALAMAKKGRKVVLIERDLSYQDRIVGELLQPGGIRALERLGLDDCAKEGIDSIMVHGYVVIDPVTNAPHNSTQPRFQIMKYPDRDPVNFLEYFGLPSQSSGETDSSNTLASSPSFSTKPVGRSFHHGKFVQKLREKALQHPNIQVVEGSVSKLIEEKGIVVGVEYKVKDKETSITKSVYTPLTLVADGIWSSTRKSMSSTTLTQVSSFVGVVVDHPSMEAPVPFPNHGHVILADPSPCLIYQISPTETRVLVDVLGPLPSSSNGELQSYLREKITPQLPESFRTAFLTAVETKDIKSMPNRFCPAKSPLKQGAFLIGDALNMRHPLTGGGMTVAIRDAETLSNLIGDSSNNFNDRVKLSEKYEQFLRERKCYASTINVLANALHSVFSAPPSNPTRQSLRQACFDYLNMGGPYAAGPIGLLSGLSPKTEVLATHFFMVAFFGVKQTLQEGVSMKSVCKTYDILRIACSIILPLLQQEKSTVLSWSPVQMLLTTIFPPVPLSD